MKETEKINIGGYSFTIDKDAFDMLDEYIKEIENAYINESSAGEIVESIEERIAELLLEKAGKDRVINCADIQYISGRIGKVSDLIEDEKQYTDNAQSNKKSDEFKQRRLYRDIDHRILGGVCSGIATRIKTDPVFIRIAFVIWFCVGFFCDVEALSMVAALAYISLWIIMPPAKTVEEKCRMSGKPIELGEFRESAAGTLRNVRNDIATAPCKNTLGRIISIILGSLLIILGFVGIFNISLSLFMREFVTEFLQNIWISECIDMQFFEIFNQPLLWILVTMLGGTFTVLMFYLGSLLVFDLRTPKWRPEIWLLLLLTLNVILLACFIITCIMRCALI